MLAVQLPVVDGSQPESLAQDRALCASFCKDRTLRRIVDAEGLESQKVALLNGTPGGEHQTQQIVQQFQA